MYLLFVFIYYYLPINVLLLVSLYILLIVWLIHITTVSHIPLGRRSIIIFTSLYIVRSAGRLCINSVHSDLIVDSEELIVSTVADTAFSLPFSISVAKTVKKTPKLEHGWKHYIVCTIFSNCYVPKRVDPLDNASKHKSRRRTYVLAHCSNSMLLYAKPNQYYWYRYSGPFYFWPILLVAALHELSAQAALGRR